VARGPTSVKCAAQGFPFPDGFVVTVEAYERALSADGSLERLERLLQDLDVDDTAAL
jgi:phosphoenolpyruvate synthase/pyruvate phosphate dikinase